MADIDIRCGDVRKELRKLPTGSVDCVITSPPYWRLRDYGFEGQLGLERTPQEFIRNLVGVFRQVRRVLRDDGTLWVNMGDSYAGNGAAYGNAKSTLQGAKHGAVAGARRKSKAGAGLKPKDLIGIPWRLALALQADGWYLRQDIIWHKPNGMPSSVSDRCTTNHEYIVFGLGEEADLTAQKMIEEQMFNQPIQRHSSTSAAFLPNPCYMPLRFNSRNL